MKKIITGILALTLCFGAVSCGDKEEESKASVSASSSESQKETSANEDVPSISEEDSATLLGLITGELSYNGYSITGDVPEGFDKETVKAHYKEEPPSISADGILTIDGEEYKLIPQIYSDDNKLLSVEGGGFDIKDYNKRYYYSAEEYEGLAAVEYEEYTWIINDVEELHPQLRLIYSPAGSRASNVILTFDLKRE